MGRLVTFIHYKADWRGREVVQIDPWFLGSQTCCMCGARHKEMENLSVRTMRCECGNVLGRDRNAAVNHYRYPEERENRGFAPTRVEIGDQAGSAGCPPVPFVETRMPAIMVDHESQ